MPEGKKIKIAVGVSGSGRSLLNLIKHADLYNFSVGLVFSSSEHARANEIAKQHELPLLVLDFSPMRSEEAKAKLYESFEENGIDLVVLAGFLKLLPLDKSWRGKIINIHPALLPHYGGQGMHGMRVHEAVVRAGEPLSGATVHLVTEKYDEGRILAQAKVPVYPGESPEVVSQKVFQAECRLLPAVIGAIAIGRIPCETVLELNSRGELSETG